MSPAVIPDCRTGHVRRCSALTLDDSLQAAQIPGTDGAIVAPAKEKKRQARAISPILPQFTRSQSTIIIHTRTRRRASAPLLTNPVLFLSYQPRPPHDLRGTSAIRATSFAIADHDELSPWNLRRGFTVYISDQNVYSKASTRLLAINQTCTAHRWFPGGTARRCYGSGILSGRCRTPGNPRRRW